MSRRALVTGGSGFIGHHLISALDQRGWSVTNLDHREPVAGTPSDLRLGDVRDSEAVDAAARGSDLIVHLASVVGVRAYLRSPIDVIDTTVLGARNVLAAAARSGARVVLMSTSEVFGKNPAVPWDDAGDRVLGSTELDRWSYGSAKGTAEHLAFGWHREHGVDVVVVRPFNVYGPHQRPDFVIPAAVHHVLNGRPVPLYDGGRQTRCFTEVSDLVRGVIAAADSNRATGMAFNIGSTIEVSVRDAIRVIGEVSGLPVRVDEIDTADLLGRSYEDLERRAPSVERAVELLGWSATVSLPEGALRMVRWAEDHPEWLALPTD